MQFTKLRLTGFKSFVDSTELLIEPGLTGIVGPNGCGKSNLVEALQWVMGETSARRLRGGEMDDVIFGGTTTRPARNLASVGVWLDNADRTAPVGLNESDEIEVERRIDRGKGSSYRVNGREQRARDVQLLFADAASGAQSTALVGQGRIGWLINAKPVERRLLLEEAAGISGLQARRHEAEIKLNAAETNLARLTDISLTLKSQIERLKRQARTAERYRRLSEQIRLAEAVLLHRQWQDQLERHRQAKARLANARARSDQTLAERHAAELRRDDAHRRLPERRQRATQAAQAVERLLGALHAVEAEEKRIQQALRDHRQRLQQLNQDAVRERNLTVEAAATLQRLNTETAVLTNEAESAPEHEREATQALAAAREAGQAIDRQLAAATQRAATAEAQRQALTRRLTGIEDRRAKLRRQIFEAELRSRDLERQSVSPADLAAASDQVRACEAALEQARLAGETAETRLRQTQMAEAAARQAAQTAMSGVVSLRAEIDGLRRLVASGLGKGSRPALDQITVTPGLETALGAALGDDLLADLDPGAQAHWVALPDSGAVPAALPAGAESLAPAVMAPQALNRRLQQIGLVSDAASGRDLQSHLQPGQRLVSRDGGLWRWDGLTLAAGAPNAAAIRLGQRNRLAQLEARYTEAQQTQAEADQARRDQAEQVAAAVAAERQARDQQRDATQQIAVARQTETALMQQHGQAQARQQALTEQRGEWGEDLAMADEHYAEAMAEQAELSDPGEDRALIAGLRESLAAARQDENQALRGLDQILREQQIRKARLASLATEISLWQARAEQAAEQAETLAQRRAELDSAIEAIAEQPDILAEKRQQIKTTIAEAREAAEAANTALQEAEAGARAADAEVNTANTTHNAATEERIRSEAAVEQAQELCTAAAQRVVDGFDCAPEALPVQAGFPDDLPVQTANELEMRLDRLKRDREAVGPVNLMAEAELAQMSQELTMIETESADLVAAIARLRQAIQQLNTEGRQRLIEAFDRVNTHFQALFVRLFGGGRAYLELTRHETDPLAAGIEIMASPPGKKLQVLSLLSGGERALTALALVFAVFLTNPAPICVLDEVDAPLDDANVERFCQMVRDIGGRTGTRFLVITHHRVSMARMDRLYGVTMMERGVSKLVSVELAGADRLRQTA